MSRSNKKFAYGNGEEEETDAFIQGALSSAPKHVEPMELHTGNFARDGSYYAVDTGNGGERKHPNRCARIIVYLCAGIVFIFGIALMALGGVEKKKGILPICPNCDKVIPILFAVGAAMLLFGGLGILSAYSRNGCIACIFGTILVLLCILCLGSGIAFLIVIKGSHLDDLWLSAVKRDTDAICKVQDKLQCSGFKQCCYFVNASGQAVQPPTAFLMREQEQLQEQRQELRFAELEAADGAGNSTTTTAAPPTTTSVGPTTTAAPPAATTTTIAPAPDSNIASCKNITIDANSTAYQEALKWCVPSCTPTKPMPPCEPKVRDDLDKLKNPFVGIMFPLGILCGLVVWATKRMVSTED